MADDMCSCVFLCLKIFLVLIINGVYANRNDQLEQIPLGSSILLKSGKGYRNQKSMRTAQLIFSFQIWYYYVWLTNG